MHPSQATIHTNNMTVSPPPPSEVVNVESPREKRRKMALAAGNEKRLQLLHKLGIRDETTRQLQTTATRRPSKGLLDGANVTKEPLKYQEEEEEEDDMMEEDDQAKSWKERLFFKPSSVESSAEDTTTAASSLASTTSEERRITFNEEVSVMPIPMRHDYSSRVRERLWNDADNIMMNAQRNALEFASEGWDWRSVTEDEYMYRDAESGEMIHPVHMAEYDE